MAAVSQPTPVPPIDLHAIAANDGLRAALNRGIAAELDEAPGTATSSFFEALALAHIAAGEVAAADFVLRRSTTKLNSSIGAAVAALDRGEWGIAFAALNSLPHTWLRELALARIATDGVAAQTTIYPGTTKEDAAQQLGVNLQYAHGGESLVAKPRDMQEVIADASNSMRRPLERAL